MEYLRQHPCGDSLILNTLCDDVTQSLSHNHIINFFLSFSFINFQVKYDKVDCAAVCVSECHLSII